MRCPAFGAALANHAPEGVLLRARTESGPCGFEDPHESGQLQLL